jgi:predicted aspartyl protease
MALVAAGVSLTAACAPTAAPPPATLAAPSTVPLQLSADAMLVSVTINRSQQAAVFLVDTGASRTFLSPLLATRLALSVPPDAPRQDLRIVGGSVISVPLVRVASFQVGEALVERMEVGVYEFAPESRVIDGLLGSDFLNRFKVTFDRQSGHMILEPLPTARR